MAAAPLPTGLTLLKVMTKDPDGKGAVALCTQPGTGEKAVVLLHRKAWTDADISSTIEGTATQLQEFHRNDKFSKYHAQPPSSANEVISMRSPVTADPLRGPFANAEHRHCNHAPLKSPIFPSLSRSRSQ